MVLYVTAPGACVHQTHGRLRVTQGKTLLQELRIAEVERVVIVGGSAGVTSTAATALMDAGIETAFLSSTGSFRGWLSPAKGRGVTLRLKQNEAFHDPVRRIGIARAIVAQKIKSGDALLARFSRNHAEFDPAVERGRIARALTAARSATDIDALMGHEGIAAVAYFAAFGRMLRAPFSFTVRSRRPPMDPANALLSLGYTLLCAEATGAVAGAGLDPALGMLHAPQDGRPSLGLDLAEEFRQAVVDRVVLSVVNNRVLSPLTDFEAQGDGAGILLTASARKRFYAAYEKRMSDPMKGESASRATLTTLREQLRAQAVLLARALQSGGEYVPFVLAE